MPLDYIKVGTKLKALFPPYIPLKLFKRILCKLTSGLPLVAPCSRRHSRKEKALKEAFKEENSIKRGKRHSWREIEFKCTDTQTARCMYIIRY